MATANNNELNLDSMYLVQKRHNEMKQKALLEQEIAERNARAKAYSKMVSREAKLAELKENLEMIFAPIIGVAFLLGMGWLMAIGFSLFL